MKRRVLVVVSAMLLSSSMGYPLSAQAPSVNQLSEIAQLLENNDVGALRQYLSANPRLLDGGSEVSGLLREFYSESENINEFVGFSESLRDVFGDPNFEDGPSQSSSSGGGGGASGGGSVSGAGFEPASGEIY